MLEVLAVELPLLEFPPIEVIHIFNSSLDDFIDVDSRYQLLLRIDQRPMRLMNLFKMLMETSLIQQLVKM